MLLKEYIKEIILLEKTSPYFKHFFEKKPLEAYAIFYDQRKLLEYFKNDETSYHGYNFFDFLKDRIEIGIENMPSDELNIGILISVSCINIFVKPSLNLTIA